jgi:hypothetical protein
MMNKVNASPGAKIRGIRWMLRVKCRESRVVLEPRLRANLFMPPPRHYLILFWSCLLLWNHDGCGQLPAPVHTNLFGDDMVVKADAHLNGGPAAGSPMERNGGLAGYEHSIVFVGGGELRGHLVSLDQESVVWQRPDFSAPCRFALGEISQLILNGADAWLESEYPDREDQRDPPVRATAQLAGGDWLSGEIVSPDGNSFSLELDGAVFSFRRDQARGLRF